MWIVVTFSVLVVGQVAGNKSLTKLSLKNGDIAYTVNVISLNQHIAEVTDGRFVVTATVSKNLQACDVQFNPRKAVEILQTPTVVVESIGTKKIHKMLRTCHKYLKRSLETRELDDGQQFNYDLAQSQPFEGDLHSGIPDGSGSHIAIFPGTKWCGTGNNADDYGDLGAFNETDACCRTHDHCPFYIESKDTKYHLHNSNIWTLSHCECDEHLYQCLKDVNNPTANTVGTLFYGVLSVKCFTFEEGDYCEDHHSDLSDLVCKHEGHGPMAVVQNFPYKWDSDDSSPDTTEGPTTSTDTTTATEITSDVVG